MLSAYDSSDLSYSADQQEKAAYYEEQQAAHAAAVITKPHVKMRVTPLTRRAMPTFMPAVQTTPGKPTPRFIKWIRQYGNRIGRKKMLIMR
jgi:hypothetical protein